MSPCLAGFQLTGGHPAGRDAAVPAPPVRTDTHHRRTDTSPLGVVTV